MKFIMLISALCSLALLACAEDDTFLPSDERQDGAPHACLEEGGCDMVVRLSYDGARREQIDITFIDPYEHRTVPRTPGTYSYDADTDRSIWSFSSWGVVKGDYAALVWGQTEELSGMELSWHLGKSSYADRFNPAIGESCGLTLSCPNDLECMKLSTGVGQGYTCVTRCFTDAQCFDQCEPPPSGDLAVEGVEGVCRSSIIQE